MEMSVWRCVGMFVRCTSQAHRYPSKHSIRYLTYSASNHHNLLTVIALPYHLIPKLLSIVAHDDAPHTPTAVPSIAHEVYYLNERNTLAPFKFWKEMSNTINTVLKNTSHWHQVKETYACAFPGGHRLFFGCSLGQRDIHLWQLPTLNLKYRKW